LPVQKGSLVTNPPRYGAQFIAPSGVKNVLTPGSSGDRRYPLWRDSLIRLTLCQKRLAGFRTLILTDDSDKYWV
jgi:hypothetical protein